MKNRKTYTLGIDFDGTCVEHEFPKIGRDIGATRVLRRLVNSGHRLILFTMRSDKKFNASDVKDDTGTIDSTPGMHLTDAVNWFKDNNLPLYGIQTNPTQHTWTESPKAFCDMYIDDAALGCPLKIGSNGRGYVDWDKVEAMLTDMGILYV